MDISQRLLLSLIEDTHSHRRSFEGLKDVYRGAYGGLRGFLIGGEYYEMLDQFRDHIDRDYFLFLCGAVQRGELLSARLLMFRVQDRYPESVWEPILCGKLKIKKKTVLEAIDACS